MMTILNYQASMSERITAQTCTKYPGHTTHPITGICIQEECQNSPLVYHHRGHTIITYEYLSKAEKNAGSAALSDKVMRMFGEEEEKITELAVKSCRALAQETLKICQKFNSEHPFLQTLTNSFKKQRLSEVLKLLASRPHQVKPESMKNYLKMLRTYYFDGGYQYNTIKTQGEQIQKDFGKLFGQAQNQIKKIIDTLHKKIINYNPYEECSLYSIKIQAESIPTYNLIEQQPSSQNKMVEQSDIYESSEMHERRLLKKYNLSRNQCTQFERVVMRETKECKINDMVKLIDPLRIRELALLNSSSTCVIDREAQQHISAMINLKVLKLFWARDLSDIAVCNMIKFMTNLEVLVLCQFQNCTSTMVNAIKINNPNLKKICFNMYMNHFIRLSQQTLEFLPDVAYNYMHEKEWISLTSGMPDLSNIELHHPENKKYWCNYIEKNANRLTQFTLSNIDQTEDSENTQKNKQQDYTAIVKSVKACKNINFLRFEQCEFNEYELIKIIENNKNIQTFISNECSNMSHKTIETLAASCPKIQEVILMMNDKITAESFRNMKSLKTLVIRGCWGMKETKFIETVKQLQELKSLSIDFNPQWVSGKTLKTISDLKKLKVLSICGNGLTNADIKHLTSPSLQTLICSNNMFSYTQLMILPFAKTLKRLSISKNIRTFPQDDVYEKIEMKLLAQEFPALTHLKLKGFKNIKPDFLVVLNRLICFAISESNAIDINISRKFCTQHKISFYSAN